MFAPVADAACAGDVEWLRKLKATGVDMDLAQPCGYGSVWTPLHLATNRGHMECVRWLLGLGVAVDALNTEGDTVSNGYVDIVRLLLRHGACVSAANATRHGTPLAMATIHSCRGAARVLLEHGASLNELRIRVPTWLHDIVASMAAARRAAALMIGLRRFGRSPVLRDNALDVVKIIARLLCASRGCADNLRQ